MFIAARVCFTTARLDDRELLCGVSNFVISLPLKRGEELLLDSLKDSLKESLETLVAILHSKR